MEIIIGIGARWEIILTNRNPRSGQPPLGPEPVLWSQRTLMDQRPLPVSLSS
jgi:hypothetical protein